MAKNQEYATPPQSGFDLTYSLSSTSSQLIPRIRGRMRKHKPHESLDALQSPERVVTTPPSFPAVHSAPSTNPPTKKARGRRPSQPASARKRGTQAPVQAQGSQRQALVSSVIYIKPGEDVYSNILSFSQKAGSVCILSACGAISHATIQQTIISDETITHEGSFLIMSLAGSYAVSEFGSRRSKTGGLNIIISGEDGRVIGGCVAGPLRAATPVQVVLGKFGEDMPPNNQDVGAP